MRVVVSEYIDIRYGECKTCHKDGKSINDNFRDIDYVYTEPYRYKVANLLDKLMLPFPKEEEIFRGTCHDILFLNSHGAVVKIGPTNLSDLVNPLILQPLTCLQDYDCNLTIKCNESLGAMPLTVAVYGGIDLLKAHVTDTSEFEGEILSLLEDTDQDYEDVIAENIGLVNVGEYYEDVLLDADNASNRSFTYLKDDRECISESLSGRFNNAADIMDITMQELFNDKIPDDIDGKMSVFYAHQPLRHMFDEAGDDKNKLRAVWDFCAKITNNPKQNIKTHVWKVNEYKSGRKHFVRKEITIPELVLKTPWTKPIEEQRATIKMVA